MAEEGRRLVVVDGACSVLLELLVDRLALAARFISTASLTVEELDVLFN